MPVTSSYLHCVDSSEVFTCLLFQPVPRDDDAQFQLDLKVSVVRGLECTRAREFHQPCVLKAAQTVNELSGFRLTPVSWSVFSIDMEVTCKTQSSCEKYRKFIR